MTAFDVAWTSTFGTLVVNLPRAETVVSTKVREANATVAAMKATMASAPRNSGLDGDRS